MTKKNTDPGVCDHCNKEVSARVEVEVVIKSGNVKAMKVCVGCWIDLE